MSQDLQLTISLQISLVWAHECAIEHSDEPLLSIVTCVAQEIHRFALLPKAVGGKTLNLLIYTTQQKTLLSHTQPCMYYT